MVLSCGVVLLILWRYERLVKGEITALRKRMKELDIDYYLIGTSDAHNSEYVSDHDMVLRYFSGFTGSNGTLLVSRDEALLWTDGRYYIQCEKELEGSGITMMRESDGNSITVSKYLAEHLKPGMSFGFNGACITKRMCDRFLDHVKCSIGFGHDDNADIRILADGDIAGDLWDGSKTRPKEHIGKLWIHDLKYSGETVRDKLKRVSDKLLQYGCRHIFLSSPEDVMWLFNIRGEDVRFNPIALSYALITTGTDDKEPSAVLFVKDGAADDIKDEILRSADIEIKPYNGVYDELKAHIYTGNVLTDESMVSVRAFKALEAGLFTSGTGATVINRTNPAAVLKAVLNDVQIENAKDYFVKDSAVTAVFLYLLKKRAGVRTDNRADEIFKDLDLSRFTNEIDREGLNELTAGNLMDALRLSVKDCFDLSFTTIAAYGANAAMMHYEATPSSYSKIEDHGMFLVDCGGQYPGATTDVTRTIAVGPVSDEEKRCFTLVLKGWLSLMHAVWIEGCTGRNLDILARQYLWKEGLDYKCGTGHGTGYCLSVHEGPRGIRYRYVEGLPETVLRPGMTVTDEPGVYIKDKFGIRTENTLIVAFDKEAEGDRYLKFENLTWVPVDEELIDYDMLDEEEKRLLDEYQNECYEKIKGVITGLL